MCGLLLGARGAPGAGPLDIKQSTVWYFSHLIRTVSRRAKRACETFAGFGSIDVALDIAPGTGELQLLDFADPVS